MVTVAWTIQPVLILAPLDSSSDASRLRLLRCTYIVQTLYRHCTYISNFGCNTDKSDWFLWWFPSMPLGEGRGSRLRLKYDGTHAETRFCLSAKWTSSFKSQGLQFSRLLAAEVYASAVVMLDTPCSEVVKGTGYSLHSPDSPSLPLPCVTVCHHVSTGLYLT
jgi:hypothetical protein